MSIQHRPDRRLAWRARMRLPDGREVSRSFETKRDARAWLESERAKLRRGDWIDPRAGDQTVSDLVWEVHESKVQLSDRSRELYETIIRNQIDPFLGQWSIRRLTREVVQQWVGELSRELAPSTVVRAHMLLQNALTYAVKQRRLPYSPAEDVNLPRIERSDHRYLSMGEVEELAQAMPEHARMFVYLGALAGLRPGESLALRWDSVDLTLGRLRVAGTMQENGRVTGPKTDTSRRRVALPGSLTDQLRAWRSRCDDDHVVVKERGGPYVGNDFRRRIWRPAVTASVGEPMRAHDLRHTHAALLIATGAHPKTIQMRLGHRDIRMTLNTYGHLMDGLDDEAAARLDTIRSHGTNGTTEPVDNPTALVH